MGDGPYVELLRGTDIVDDGVECATKLGNVAGLQNEPNSFYPFIDVRVGIERSFAGGGLAAGEPTEVVDDSMRFQQIEHAGDAALHVHLPARLPESVA